MGPTLNKTKYRTTGDFLRCRLLKGLSAHPMNKRRAGGLMEAPAPESTSKAAVS